MVRLPISYLIRNLYHLQTDSSSSTDDNFQLKQNKIIGLQFSLKLILQNILKTLELGSRSGNQISGKQNKKINFNRDIAYSGL